MGFLIDKQTVEDLNLLGRFKKDSVINIYDRTCTRGGRRLLAQMFRDPMSDAGRINARARVIDWFRNVDARLPLREEDMDLIEFYSSFGSYDNALANACGVVWTRIRGILFADNAYDNLQGGFRKFRCLVDDLSHFFDALPEDGSPIKEDIEWFRSAFGQTLSEDIVDDEKSRIPLRRFLSEDWKVRKMGKKCLERLSDMIFSLDVYTSVARVAVERGFCAPVAVTGDNVRLEIKGVRHPALRHAVTNDVSLDSERNLLFLTGVNMAGKSTLMKSVAISAYLAHMGFPVPAESLTFTPLDGLFTSINISDDISRGYSHFYAEVMRVKGIARHVHDGRRLLVLFDELFKGTNVKDAFDATLAVVSAFAKHGNCLYVISTHITEVGEELSKAGGNAIFKCLSSEMRDGRLSYTYTLRDGISSDRHGMTIIRNEHVLDIIRNAGKNQRKEAQGE